MKMMAILLIFFTGSSLAMQENPMYSPSVVQKQDSKKAPFMSLIRRLLPKQKEKAGDHEIKQTIKAKIRKSSKSSISSSPGLFDLQPIDTDDMTMLTNENEFRYDYFMKEVEGRN